jgi:sugar/nucleoside kinase (ribokinase family)
VALIACFGSLNLDLTLPVPRLPAVDETLAARDLLRFRGGKGHNQATAAARLARPGTAVAMVGTVGGDPAGDLLVDGLAADGVDVRFVGRGPAGVPTGTAVCLVGDDGTGAIVIVAGANATVSPALADAAAEALGAADVLLLQGEVPVEASVRAAELVRAGGGRVVVNPAPVPAGAGPGAGALAAAADVLVVNRVEAAALGVGPGPGVVVTLGAGGARVGGTHLPAFPATAVDPTGAGDAFAGALAVALAEGASLADAARFGAAAGACAVEALGAEPSFPRRSAVEARLAGPSGPSVPRG